MKEPQEGPSVRAGPEPDTELSAEGDVGSAMPCVLTVDELAGLLRCNRKTVYAAIQRGEIPGVRKLGGAIRVHRDTVLTWLAQGQGRAPRSRGSR